MSDPRDLYRFLLTIGLGCAGGYLASLLNLPLAWMIGAMLANTAAALLGAPLYVFAWLRNVMVCVLGVMLGSSFTPEILGVIGDWAVSLLLLLLVAVVCLAAAPPSGTVARPTAGACVAGRLLPPLGVTAWRRCSCGLPAT